ncbi:MAG: histidine phosphatase family protein [Proteobacteria bacterium]|nr:histidine phosphatase family protein [Pseudomonadota bacterium]
MGTLYLIRHGQASLGAADYDQLSELGAQQCHRLGRYFNARGRRFGLVLRGTLRRHEQSLAALAQGLGDDALRQPARVLPGLDEYDSQALVQAVHAPSLGPIVTAEDRRRHFRLLRQGLAAWINGETRPAGMPSHADFSAGVRAALDQVREHAAAADGDVLLVSSGGPISNAVAQVLGAPALAAIELNLQMRNSAITEFDVNARRHALKAFNHLPHLDDAEAAAWVTYA